MSMSPEQYAALRVGDRVLYAAPVTSTRWVETVVASITDRTDLRTDGAAEVQRTLTLVGPDDPRSWAGSVREPSALAPVAGPHPDPVRRRIRAALDHLEFGSSGLASAELVLALSEIDRE